MAKKRLIHYVSINLKVKSDGEDKPTQEEISDALKAKLSEDPTFKDIEVFDSEENNEDN